MTTKQMGTIMWEHYEGYPLWTMRPKTFLGYTFEDRTVYHDSKGYYVRVNGHRRNARPVGKNTPPTKFKVLGTTTYR